MTTLNANGSVITPKILLEAARIAENQGEVRIINVNTSPMPGVRVSDLEPVFQTVCAAIEERQRRDFEELICQQKKQ